MFYSLTAHRDIRSKISSEIAQIKSKHPRFQPNLVILQRGNRSDSSTYVKMKLKAAEEAGMTCSLIALPETSTVEEVIAQVQKCNADAGVDGILVQLPLGEGVDSDGERRVVEAVSEAKDVDGCVSFLLLRFCASAPFD